MKLDPKIHYTCAHYKTWPDEERWELIEGVAYSMSPAPMRKHQGVARIINEKMSAFLRGKPCKVYPAPFDVLLPNADEPEDEVDTVVQPDIVVYCGPSKVHEHGARGAPDLAIEILSPSTSKKDLNEKYRLFERHGVREYWVVDPGNKAVHVWRLQAKGGFDEGELRDLLRDPSPIESQVLAGLVVDPKELFADVD